MRMRSLICINAVKGLALRFRLGPKLQQLTNQLSSHSFDREWLLKMFMQLGFSTFDTKKWYKKWASSSTDQATSPRCACTRLQHANVRASHTAGPNLSALIFASANSSLPTHVRGFQNTSQVSARVSSSNLSLRLEVAPIDNRDYVDTPIRPSLNLFWACVCSITLEARLDESHPVQNCPAPSARLQWNKVTEFGRSKIERSGTWKRGGGGGTPSKIWT